MRKKPMTKKELLDLLSVQCIHNDRCKHYHNEIKNLLVGVNDNAEIRGISMLTEKEFENNDSFDAFLREHDEAYVEQQLYALSCSIADFAMQYAEASAYACQEVYEKRKRSWFGIFRNVALIALIGVAILFTILEEKDVIHTDGLVATIIGAFDLCFGIISYLVERWSDEKKDKEAFAGARQTKSKIEDQQANLDNEYEKRIKQLIVVVDQRPTYNGSVGTVVENGGTVYQTIVTNNTTVNNDISPEVMKMLQKMQQDMSAAMATVKENQTIKDAIKRIEDTISHPADLSATLTQVTGETRQIASQSNGDENIIAACNEVADSVAAIADKQDVDRKAVDSELLLLRMQIYFDAMRNGYNDICVNGNMSFTGVKNYRKGFADALAQAGIDKDATLEARVISTLRPDPEDVKREADKMLDDFASKYDVEGECKNAMQGYFDALRMEFNGICVGEKGWFVNVKDHREDIVSVASEWNINIDDAMLSELENRILAVLHPDPEAAKRNADKILEDYKNKILTQCKG